MKLVVLVTGAPAAGKTTLAERLAAELSVPLFAKDSIKAALHSALGAEDPDASRALSQASFEVLGHIASAVARAGGSAIVEANFTAGAGEAALRGSFTHQVVVACEPAENLRRYRLRERSPMHFDRVAIARLERGLDEGWYGALDLGIPTMEVDTTGGYRPSYDEVRAFVTRPPRGALLPPR